MCIVDNDYLAQFLKYGLVGIILNLILLLSIYITTLRSKVIYPNSSKFILSVLFGYSIFASMSATFLSLLNMIPLMLITGFLIKVGDINNEIN